MQYVRAIHLEVVRRNVAALEFYRKLGFKDHDHYMMTLRVPSHF
jgi:ribosomal protein S18 acetylase RimI-like enzyme